MRHFLKFDAETRRFVLAGDPADGHIETILQAMTDISARGDLVTQIKILNHLSGEIPKNKIVSLLRQHSGTHWTVGTGKRNANIYVPNSVHQLSAPLRGWRTGELAESTFAAWLTLLIPCFSMIKLTRAAKVSRFFSPFLFFRLTHKTKPDLLRGL